MLSLTIGRYEKMLSQAKITESNAVYTTQPNAGVLNAKRSGKWDCTLSEVLIGEYWIIPLTSKKMLKSEGYAMNNCCRDYTSRCEEMEYCIFSIRDRTGERMATLGLKKEQSYWYLDQCFGASNKDVLEETKSYFDEDGMEQTESTSSEMYYVAHEVARLMNAIGNC